MARLATFAEDLIFVLRLPIMAVEAVGHRRLLRSRVPSG